VVESPPVSPRRHHGNLRSQSFSKLKQVLDYSSSIEKVSELLGVDAPTVYEIYQEQAEDECQKRMLKNTPRNKRNSQKALSLLGLDPSKEKVKKTLGIDEEAVHQVEEDMLKQQELLCEAYRKIEGSPPKKNCTKALSTLGLDPSVHKATKLLGVDEEILRDVLHEEQLIQEEKILLKRRHNTLLLHDKKHNHKAHNIIGYDPSYNKILDTLGVAAGTSEEVQVRSIIPTQATPTHAHQSEWWSTPLVYTLSAVVLVTSLASSSL